MKLTSEEFNAIFTFYDKVRGKSMGWKRRSLSPVVAMARTAWSVGGDPLSRGFIWACGFFLLLHGKANGTL